MQLYDKAPACSSRALWERHQGCSKVEQTLPGKLHRELVPLVPVSGTPPTPSHLCPSTISTEKVTASGLEKTPLLNYPACFSKHAKKWKPLWRTGQADMHFQKATMCSEELFFPIVFSEHNVISEHRCSSDIWGCPAPAILHTLPLPGKAAGKVRLPSIAAVQAPWEHHSPTAQKLLLSELLLLGMRNWPRWFQNLPGNNITILSLEALPPTS